jgi:zinc D-Ala-D-Ala carboxypeptidase
MGMSKKKDNSELFTIGLIAGGTFLLAAIVGLKRRDISAGPINYGFDPSYFSKYYNLNDVTRSSKAQQLGIDNSIPGSLIENAQKLAQFVLDPISDVLGKQQINSWFRVPALNQALDGSSGSSDHLKAEAADIEDPSGNNIKIIRTVLSKDIPFDQMIIYDSMDHPSRIHISYNSENNPDSQIGRILFKDSSGYSVIDTPTALDHYL